MHESALTALFAVSPSVLAVLPLMGGIPSMPVAGEIDPDHRAHAAAVFERLLQDHANRSDWRELRGESVIESFVRHALTCDLMVLGQRNPRDAAGFEAILSGARARLPDDDDFLREIGTVLDSLYTHYGKESPQ